MLEGEGGEIGMTTRGELCEVLVIYDKLITLNTLDTYHVLFSAEIGEKGSGHIPSSEDINGKRRKI